MPRLQDKVLINEGGTRGRYKAMKADFGVMQVLADEIEAMGLAGDPEALQMLDAMQGSCDRYDQAADDYTADNRKMIRWMQQFIDSKLAQQKQP